MVRRSAPFGPFGGGSGTRSHTVRRYSSCFTALSPAGFGYCRYCSTQSRPRLSNSIDTGWRIIGSQATTFAVNPGGSVIRFTASSGVKPWPTAEPPARIEPAHKTNRTPRMAHLPTRQGSATAAGNARADMAYRESSSGRWLALAAALLGWMFDGMEMGLFPLVGKDAVSELLRVPGRIQEASLVPGSEGEASFKKELQGEVDRWYGVVLAAFLVGAATGG